MMTVHMKRIPEPELMDEMEQARAYDEADFDAPNANFVDHFERHVIAHLEADHPSAVLDLGCGPAEIPIELVNRWPTLIVDAVDGAESMLAFARKRLSQCPNADRVQLHHRFLPIESLPGTQQFDAVISNSLLHHLHDPFVLWRDIKRYGAPGARVLVVDLMRPPSIEQAKSLLALYAEGEPDVLRRDFYNSLLAAFTPDEIRGQIAACDLQGLLVEEISDRHVMISGALPS